MKTQTKHNKKRNFAWILTILMLTGLFGMASMSLAAEGSWTKHEIQSAAIAKNIMGISSLRRVAVYTPDGYEQGNQRYPVIYWIPGWTEFRPLDMYRQPLDDAIKTGKIPPTIAVFIDVSDGTVFLNSPEFGYWEDFLISELIPFIDKTYRTVPDWRKRALMGASMGGYNAIILPVLHPNIWGAVGANDGAFWIGYHVNLIGKEQDIPAPIRNNVNVVQNLLKGMHNNLKFEDYKTVDFIQKVIIQLGVAISPNPAAPLHFDVPVTPDVIEKWRAYCPTDPTTIAELSNLSMIAVVVPEGIDEWNRPAAILMIDLMKAEGISVTRLDMPGAHVDFMPERFVALAEQVLKSMGGVTSVEAKGKLPVAWGEIKQGKY